MQITVFEGEPKAVEREVNAWATDGTVRVMIGVAHLVRDGKYLAVVTWQNPPTQQHVVPARLATIRDGVD